MLLKQLLKAIRVGTPRTWVPDQLFRNGEVGAWYNPSDLSTLFQDAAGTTPVTDVEQPVGLMLDKSGNGFNATQFTAAARPVLSSRYNLVEKTEQFDDVYWTATRMTVTANAIASPDGSVSASRLESNDGLESYVDAPANVTQSTTLTQSIFVKKDNSNYCHILAWNGSDSGARAWFNINTGSIGTSTTFGSAFSFSNLNITDQSDGWFRCNATLQKPAGSTVRVRVSPSDGDGTVTSAVGLAIYAWGADLRESQYSNLPYQRVNTASDYDFDFSQFPPYLLDDQIDDQMSVTLPAMSTATTAEATDDGVTITYPVNIPAGVYVLDTTSTIGRDYGRVIIDRALTTAEQFYLQTYLDTKRGAA